MNKNTEFVYYFWIDLEVEIDKLLRKKKMKFDKSGLKFIVKVVKKLCKEHGIKFIKGP